MRSSSRRLNRRSPSRRCSWSPRHSSVSSASATSSVRVASDREDVVVVEHVDELRMAAHRVADDAARAEQVAGPLGGAGLVAEGDRERRRAGRTLGQASELQQAEVGIGRLGQPPEDHRQQLRITRDRRVSPAASSRTAARVRSTSVKPNAARRSSAASG